MELDDLIEKLTEIRDRNQSGDSIVFISMKTSEEYFGGDITDIFMNCSGGLTIEAVDKGY